jgi:DNA-directed RNA polymerase specialized sigma24 family protein
VSSTSDPEPPDPGDFLDDDPSTEHDREVIDALLERCADWMRDRARHAAVPRNLDPADVFQHTMVRLLRASVTVDLSNCGLKSWLGQLIDWSAQDLARERHHDGGERIGHDEFEARRVELDLRACTEDPLDGSGIDTAFLKRVGLTPHQIGVLLGECSRLDLTLREYARLVGRGYAAVRKDLERARRRMERWIGLSEEERRVFVAFRCHRSLNKAAHHVGCPIAEFRAVLDTAQKKIYEALNERGAGLDAQ